MKVIRRSFEDLAAEVDILGFKDVRVFRIADIDRIPWPARALFQGLTPDALKEATRYAPEGTVDAESGNLLLSFNIHLIETPSFVALIDAGIGNGKERPDRPAWHQRRGRFLETLEGLGFAPEAVDLVVNTHLHADHVGWNTVLGESGWKPTFPRARYVVPEAEFTHWNALQDADPARPILHGSFRDSVLPLVEAGCLETVPSCQELAPGLRFEPAGGHSPGMCVVRLTREGASVLFTADVLHHPFQLTNRAMVSNFCEDPAMAKNTRERLLADNAGTGAVLAPYHFPSPAFGSIEREGEDLRFVPLPILGTEEG